MIRRLLFTVVTTLVLGWCAAPPARGADLRAPVQEPDGSEGVGWNSQPQRLTGDWGGRRSALEEDGLTLELFFTADVLSNVSGGVRRDTAVLGDVDFLLTLETERLLGWPGGLLYLYVLGTFGGSISEAVGDLQGVSNIEAPDNLLLYEAWYEQEFEGARLSLLAGLYDVTSEFDVIPAAGLFVQSAHGTGSEFGNSGRNGPSTFPATSLGARARWQPAEALYLQSVVADGVPGDPGDPSGTQVSLDADDGLLLVGEFGFINLPSKELRGRVRLRNEELPPLERHYGYFGKFAIGLWGYTSEFDDFVRVDGSGSPQNFRGTEGAYALAEQRLYYEEGDPFQGLSAFARVGIADDRANVFDGYVGAGTVYQGAIPGRGQDRLGLAVAAAHLGDDFKSALRQEGRPVTSWEIALELTYRARITPWLFVQPDVQYVIHPGGNPTLEDALILGARVVVSF